MGKSFLPRRWWEWALCAGLALFLVAAFWPPFAYSGPGPLTHARVASYIQKSHEYGEGWPQERDNLKVWSARKGESYDLSLKWKLPHAAVYRIVVDGNAEVWRVNEKGRSGRLTDPGS